MKRNLLKLALCAMALLPLGAWADGINFGTENVVSTTKTWIFDGLTTNTVYNSVTAIDNEYYLRASSSNPKRNFTVKEGESTLLKFSDGYCVTVSKYIESNGAMQNYGTGYISETTTAGYNSTVTVGDKTDQNVASCSFAFNASVEGTLYVLGSHTTAGKKPRIYYLNGTTKANTDYSDTEGVIQELTYSTVGKGAGTFIIGNPGSNFQIYAVRFVPTAEKKDRWVYIGATGYATFSYGSGHYTTPDGLSAYGAKASSDGTAVELIPAENIKKMTGYILKGTPNTNYYLTSTETAPTNPSGNEMQYASGGGEKTFSVDGNVKDDEDKYNYILAAEGGVAKFFAVENGTTLSSGKAWLRTSTQLTPSPNARGVSIIFEDDQTTGIANTIKAQIADDSWYTLQGVKVAQPTKGIYVKNGKKVVVK